jgi:hypothetical protein
LLAITLGAVLLKFVADKPSNLSKGKLYAAKVRWELGDRASVGWVIEWG